MSAKKKVAGILCTALVLMSTSAFAGATYSVHDDKVYDQLNDIKGQLETIKKYLAVVEEKEKSIDLLEKNAADRTNDSMQKLSVAEDSEFAKMVNDTANSFISKQDENTPEGKKVANIWRKIIAAVGAGKGNFLEIAMNVLSADNKAFTQYIDSLDTFKIPLDRFVLQFDGICDGRNFNGLKTPDAKIKVYYQNMQELAKLREQIKNDVDKVNEMDEELDKKGDKYLEEIGKAKDSKSSEKKSLANAIKNSQSLIANLDNAKDILSGKGIGVKDLGSVLSNGNMQTIFMKDDTKSITGAQEQTSALVGQQINFDIRKAIKKAKIYSGAKLKLDQLEIAINLNKEHLTIALSDGARETLSPDKIDNDKGQKISCAFEDEYGDN